MNKDIEVFVDILLDEIGIALKSYNLSIDLMLSKDYPLINEYVARINGKIDATLNFIEIIHCIEERFSDEYDFKKVDKKDF